MEVISGWISLPEFPADDAGGWVGSLKLSAETEHETAQLSSQLRQVEAELAKVVQITPPAHDSTAKATVECWPFSSWEWIQCWCLPNTSHPLPVGAMTG